jgi:hypothetical protein
MTETTRYRTVAALILASVFLHGFAYYVQIELRKLLPYRYPYWWSILGSALMIWLPVGLWRGGSPRFTLFFAIFTFLTGLGLCYSAFTRS